MQTLLEALRIEMALKLNNSDAGGGIHVIFYEGLKKKKPKTCCYHNSILPPLRNVALCLHAETLTCSACSCASLCVCAPVGKGHFTKG